MEKKKCPKCEGEMEEGIIADRGHLSLGEKPQWGTGLAWGGITLKDKKEVKTYRCNSCGYLESYAK